MPRRRRFWAVGIGRAVLVAGAFALALPSRVAAQALDGGSGESVVSLGVWDWLGLIARLVAVLGVIWAAFWGMRWYTRRTQLGGGGRGALEVLETRALGPNRSLQLVRVGRRAVLVGVTADRINQLLEIDDPDEVEGLAQTLEAQRESAGGLGRLAGSMSRFALPSMRPRGAGRTNSPSMAAGEALTGGPDYAPAAPPAPAAQLQARQLEATSAYRQARIAELQRAIEDARRGTSFERAR